MIRIDRAGKGEVDVPMGKDEAHGELEHGHLSCQRVEGKLSGALPERVVEVIAGVLVQLPQPVRDGTLDYRSDARFPQQGYQLGGGLLGQKVVGKLPGIKRPGASQLGHFPFCFALDARARWTVRRYPHKPRPASYLEIHQCLKSLVQQLDRRQTVKLDQVDDIHSQLAATLLDREQNAVTAVIFYDFGSGNPAGSMDPTLCGQEELISSGSQEPADAFLALIVHRRGVDEVHARVEGVVQPALYVLVLPMDVAVLGGSQTESRYPDTCLAENPVFNVTRSIPLL